MQIAFFVMMFILGACFGSFLCCQARRLKLKETHHHSLGNRSVCLNCKAKLKWYENLPIISWLLLRGKCRHCGKKIGLAELLSELGLALAFLTLATTIDITSSNIIEWLIFAFTLALTLSLSFLAIYDGIYGELPVPFLILSIILATIVLSLKEWLWLSTSAFSIQFVLNPLFSVLILAGLYLTLYLISKGKWVGDGDWLLGLSIGLALADAWLALITLFLANLIACLVMLPKVKKSKNKRIYFGPFLVIAFIITISLPSCVIISLW